MRQNSSIAVASARAGVAAVGDEVVGEGGRPRAERGGGGGAHRLVGVGDLAGDGGDRACVGEPGRLEQVGATLEQLSGGVERIDVVAVERLDEFPVGYTSLLDDGPTELGLAAGEEVVQRPVRRPGRGQDRLDPRRGVPCRRSSSAAAVTRR